MAFLQAKEEMAKFNNNVQGAVKIKLDSSKSAKKKKLKRKKKKEVDPKAPKRPGSAYFEFAAKERQKVIADLDFKLKVGDYKEVAKELGRRWKSLSEDERAPFVAKAKEKMKKFWQVSLSSEVQINSQVGLYFFPSENSFTHFCVKMKFAHLNVLLKLVLLFKNFFRSEWSMTTKRLPRSN